MKPKKIEKIDGLLCITFGGGYFVRSYNSDGTFTDYNLIHSDLKIQIPEQEDAYIYNRDGELWIDHSPETLGLEVEG